MKSTSDGDALVNIFQGVEEEIDVPFFVLLTRPLPGPHLQSTCKVRQIAIS